MKDHQREILFVLLRSLQAAYRTSHLVVAAVNDFEDYVKIGNALGRMIDRTERSIEDAGMANPLPEQGGEE